MMFYLNETSTEEFFLFGGRVERKIIGKDAYNIISTHYGLFVNFEIPHLMNDPGLDLESEIDNRKTDEI